MKRQNTSPKLKGSADTDLSRCGGFFVTIMSKWKSFMNPPQKHQRIVVLYWCPEGASYNMDIVSWHGWDQREMEELGNGGCTFPIAWIAAPEYPEIPDQDYTRNG